MISKNTLIFLNNLKWNNLKKCFNENKKVYESSKNDILELIKKLLISLSDIDKTISSIDLESKKFIIRINKDLRFSKNKTPYKTDYYIIISKFGKNRLFEFYYLHIEPDNCFVGGGV